MHEVSLDEALEQILPRDPRYARDAYAFLREALDYTQKCKPKGARGKDRHVTGQELLAGVRAYALQQFGPMTITVFEEWGIRACRDFGEMVFNLVDAGLLGTTEQDTRADFDGGYDFDDAFRKPFLPSSKLPTPDAETRTTQV
jgi:uncharacterized repeat protein (TIGR04138 family)